MKDAALVGRAFPFGQWARTFHEINTGRVVRDQRIKRVHDEVEHFVGVQRSANRLGNVEQHAELVDYRQTRWSLNCFGHNQSTTLPAGNEISN